MSKKNKEKATISVRIFPSTHYMIKVSSAKKEMSIAQFIQAAKFDLAGEPKPAFELDGEWVGHLPATFSVAREQLRVVVP